MGRFLDEPQTVKGRNLLAGSSKGRNLLASKAKEKSNQVSTNPFEVASPMGAASLAGRWGVPKSERLKLSDLPYLTAKTVSGAMAGVPELIARHPHGFATGGIIGAQGERGESGGFFKPVSQAGGRLGQALEAGAGLIPLEALASKIPKIPQASRVFGKAFSKLRSTDKPIETLSSRLSGDIQKAVRTRGIPLGEYIETSGERLIKNPEQFRDMIGRLPKQLQEALAAESGLQRATIGPSGQFIMKSEEIAPTLKNLERARAVFRGGASQKVFDPRVADEQLRRAADIAYSRTGRLMREGDPDLRSLMANYALAKRAEKQLGSALSTRQGFVKPVGKIFEEGTSSIPRQAIERLAESNPEMLKTIDEIMNYQKSLSRAKMFADLKRRIGAGAAYAAGASTIARPLISGLGGNTTNIFQGGGD